MNDGYPVEVAWRVLGVPVAGDSGGSQRPRAQSVRHAMLLEVIREIHHASRQTYGAQLVHAELVHGRTSRWLVAPWNW